MFYENLRRICREKGTTVTALVAELGLSSGNLSKWKSGGSPRAATLQRLADYLEVSADSLLGEMNAPPKMSSLQYALFCETQGMTEEELALVLDFARFTKARRRPAAPMPARHPDSASD